MQATYNAMSDLFDQRGLPSDDHSITAFVHSNQIQNDVRIDDVPFWKTHQANFLKSAKSDHSDWYDLVDTLDSLLHKNNMGR